MVLSVEADASPMSGSSKNLLTFQRKSYNEENENPFGCIGISALSVWTVRFLRNSERVEVRFTSDAIDTFKGFAIDIQLQACRLGQISCDDQKQCIDAASHCDGVTQCADGSDEDWQYCAPECGKSHHDLLIEPGKIVGGVEANEFSIPVRWLRLTA